MEVVRRIPFLRLLLPLLIGIVAQYYIDIYKWSMIVALLGLTIVLFSFFIGSKYNYRHLFGLGVSFCMISVGCVSTYFRQEAARFTFPDIAAVYNAAIVDLPQEKPKTIALKIRLEDSGKQIVCYLPKCRQSRALRAGDHISFFGKIGKFERSGRFDYPSYMHNKGYAGAVFVKGDTWETTDASSLGVKELSSSCRQRILEYYRSLQLPDDGVAVLAALSLGYTDSLSDDLVRSFRTTGTAHLLAVSGMHMVIFYTVLWFISGMIFRGRNRTVRYVVILLALWLYVFVIGFPPSAVRACVMLSFLCIGGMRGVQPYSFNTLFACAFGMLVWNPLWLFDPGFQLSFAAVLSLLVFMPLLPSFKRVKNKLVRYFFDVAAISIVVQVGTLPLCLYYFGMFPAYFIVTNLLIVPLFTIAVYIAVVIVGLSVPASLFSSAAPVLMYVPVGAFKYVVNLLVYICSFFEKLPFAEFGNLHVGLLSVFLLWLISVSFIYFFKLGNPRLLILGFSGLFVLLGTGIFDTVSRKDSLYSYAEDGQFRLVYYIGFRKFEETVSENNQFVNLKGNTYYLLMEDKWKECHTPSVRKDIDYLHIAGSNEASLYSVSKIFNIKKVILDRTLSDYDTKRLALECEKLRIPCYHVPDNGVLRIFF